MVLINDSLTIVLVGDWNRLYMQPEWVAGNVFESEELEIGVSGQGAELSVSYKKNSIIVSPGQSNTVFSVVNTDDEVLNNLCKYLNNFVEKAYTPQFPAYEINVDFVEDDGYCSQKWLIQCQIQTLFLIKDMKLFQRQWVA